MSCPHDRLRINCKECDAIDTRAERDQLRAEVERLKAERWTPVGDNHHNADACPYCSPHVVKMAADLNAALSRATTAEAEIENLNSEIASWISSESSDAKKAEQRASELEAQCADYRQALNSSYNAMCSWFSSEYLSAPETRKVREILFERKAGKALLAEVTALRAVAEAARIEARRHDQEESPCELCVALSALPKGGDR